MPEQQNTEYKQSWHDDYLKWVCGFANAKGGGDPCQFPCGGGIIIEAKRKARVDESKFTMTK